MKTDKITIRIDADTAKAFKSASAQERQQLELLLNLKLRESLNNRYPLLQIMDNV